MKAAGIWRRFFAYVLDNFIMVLIVAALFFVITISSLHQVTFTLTFLAIIISLTLPFSYYVIFESSKKQASFGKRLMGIKVVNDNGSKPSIARIMLRTLLYVIPFLLYMIPLIAVFWYLPLFSKKSTVYDSLSRTRVVGD